MSTPGNAAYLIRLDNRGLKPPEPMIRILEALEHLEGGGAVEALLDRRPLFLFPELEARALSYTCEPNDYGGYTVVIRHAAAER